ncbi:MAG: hypothetical protein ABJN04_15135 [Hyphomicrobiales bacterium]
MTFNTDKFTIKVLAAVMGLWIILPLTSKSTPFNTFIEFGVGYTPVVDFHNHFRPPEIKRRYSNRVKIYKDLVWRHERYSILWLPFGGSAEGEYGLYRLQWGSGRSGATYRRAFIRLSITEARKFARTANVDLPEKYPVSYWELYFGWLILVPLMFAYALNPSYFEEIGS